MNENIEFKDTVMGKITKSAILNWGENDKNKKWFQPTEEQAEAMLSEGGIEIDGKLFDYSSSEKAKNGKTYGSENASIRGIISVLGLDPKAEQQITEDVYTRDTISEDIAKQIQGKIKRNGNSSAEIIKMLSVVHDEWVKTNPNKFMQQDRNKEYQFVPLQMLSWKEAKSDLLFLKPILEAAGVKVDEQAIEQQFEIAQKEFLIDFKIHSTDRLKELLKYYNIYPALQGLETENGGKIKELLKDDEVLDKMVAQISEQIDIKSREEMLEDIKGSNNSLYNDVYHVQSERTYSRPNIDEYMTMRDILTSKLTESKLREEYAPEGEENNYTFTRVEDKKGKVSSKSMIEAEQGVEKGLTTREVGGIKGFFAKLIDKFKGKGEK